MSFINPQEKEINCKIAYCGPVSAGKSTSLRHIYAKTAPGSRSQLVSLSSEDDPALFFDFLPLSLGKVKDFKIRIHLYSIPEHALHGNSTSLIVKGVDGVIFVVDSQIERLEENISSWKGLKKTLKQNDVNFDTVPMALQFNKRDLPNVMPTEDLSRAFNPRKAPEFETVAKTGKNVMECLQALAKKVLMELERKK